MWELCIMMGISNKVLNLMKLFWGIISINLFRKISTWINSIFNMARWKIELGKVTLQNSVSDIPQMSCSNCTIHSCSLFTDVLKHLLCWSHLDPVPIGFHFSFDAITCIDRCGFLLKQNLGDESYNNMTW